MAFWFDHAFYFVVRLFISIFFWLFFSPKHLRLPQHLPLLIFPRKRRLPFNRPGQVQGRVVPEDAALVFRRPAVSGLVQEFGRFGNHHEAMREAGRYPELPLVLGGKRHAYPQAEGRRAAADVLPPRPTLPPEPRN